MTALNVKPSIDFKVDTTTGIGYISQRKAAELLGVPRSTLQYAMKNPMIYTDTLAGVNGNENNQLDENSLAKLAYHFAQKGNEKALRAMYAFTLAGARAYIYTQAGYNPLAKEKPNKLHVPCVPVRWLCQQLGRSRASVDRTLNVSIHRMRSFGLSTEVAFVNTERCVSPALIICSMFTGKEMQRIRAWLMNIAETDALPDAQVLMQLASP